MTHGSPTPKPIVMEHSDRLNNCQIVDDQIWVLCSIITQCLKTLWPPRDSSRLCGDVTTALERANLVNICSVTVFMS